MSGISKHIGIEWVSVAKKRNRSARKRWRRRDVFEDLRQGPPGQSLLEGCLRRVENTREDFLDAPPNHASLVGLVRVHGEAWAARHGAVHLVQRDLTRLPRKPRATTHPFAGRHKASPTEIGKNAADYHGVGVYAAGEHLGRNRLLFSQCENREDVDCKSEATACGHKAWNADM